MITSIMVAGDHRTKERVELARQDTLEPLPSPEILTPFTVPVFCAETSDHVCDTPGVAAESGLYLMASTLWAGYLEARLASRLSTP